MSRGWVLITQIIFGLGVLTAPNLYAKDFSVTVGLKGWIVNYDSDYQIGGYKQSSSNKAPALIAGPSLTLRFGKVFAGVNVATGEIEEEDISLYGYTINGWPSEVDFTDTTIERNEQDIYIGYNIHPNFSVLFGHKRYKFDFSAKVTIITNDPDPFIPRGTEVYKDSTRSKGQFFGISAHTDAPRGGGLMYFFSIAQTSLKSDSEDKTKGPAIEAGVALIPKSSRLFYTLSYRQQSYETDYSDGTSDSEDYSGISGSINVIF